MDEVAQLISKIEQQVLEIIKVQRTNEQLQKQLDDIKASSEFVVNQTSLQDRRVELLIGEIKALNEKIHTIDNSFTKLETTIKVWLSMGFILGVPVVSGIVAYLLKVVLK